MTLSFARPDLLYLALLLPLWWLAIRRIRRRGVPFSPVGSPALSAQNSNVQRAIVVGLPILLRSGQFVALLLALAGLQSLDTIEEEEVRGRSLALALDISTSMLAADMNDERSRLETALQSAARFSRLREQDDVTLIAFAGEAVTRVPPTRDADLVVSGIESLRVQLVLDGTNITGAMLTSLSQLLNSDGEAPVIVLLTDGAHNAMGPAPSTAARAAAALGVRVHSIALLGERDAVPSFGTAPTGGLSERDRLQSEMETVLTAVSRITGGRYFAASGGVRLDSIFQEIHEMEGPVQVRTERQVSRSLLPWLEFTVVILMGLELALFGSRWGIIP